MQCCCSMGLTFFVKDDVETEAFRSFCVVLRVLIGVIEDTI